MRKSLGLFLILLLLSVGTIVYGSTTLLKEQNDVQFTENVLYGDKSVVDGATVERNTKYSNLIYWDTNYTVGEKPVTTTVSMVTEIGRADRFSSDYGVSTNAFPDMTFWDKYEEGDFTGIRKAFKEVFDSIQPGETGSNSVYLKDYMDYYDIEVSISLPGGVSFDSYDLQSMNWEEGESESSYYEKVHNMFSEFFKIPVVEEEMWTIEVEKQADGLQAMSGVEIIWEKEYFEVSLSCAYSDTECFFTFDTHTSKGNIIDTGLIPGGYGIYGFSYDQEKRKIDTDSLKTVYKLDPSIQILSLSMDTDKKNLLLITNEKEGCVLTVIDIASMQEKQRIVYGMESEESNRTGALSIYKDFLVLRYDYEKKAMAVVSIDEAGTYKLEYELKINETEYPDIVNYLYWASGYDWDGKKLLLGASLLESDSYYIKKCGFYLAALDENGLLYLGEYESSLDSWEQYGEEHINEYREYACEPIYVDSTKVSW